MNERKAKPAKSSKVQLREPAVPLAAPDERPLNPDHPAVQLYALAKAAEEIKPTTGTTGTVSTTGTSGTLPIAPARDYMKVANSIHREAVPSGLFKGKSKQTYDYLYSRTRGAVVPTRTVQVSWKDIMRGARIGSDKTLREHLKQLSAAGLISWAWEDGSQGGSVYTVYLPEEATGTSGTTGTGGTPSTSGQFLPAVPPVENTTGTGGLNSSHQRTSADPKTSFKTKDQIIDDEPTAFKVLGTKLQVATSELTGKQPTAADAERWGELADVLVAELRIAAARTTVSNVPAFLAEHLRRRLWKLDKKQAAEKGIETPDKTPSTASESPQDCPDCKGSGWEYPNGPDGGVRKCKHDKLTPGK